MRKRTASGKAHPVGGNHFGVFPWVFVSLRRSFASKGYKKDVAPETPDFIGGFAVSTAEKTTSDFVDVKKILFPF